MLYPLSYGGECQSRVAGGSVFTEEVAPGRVISRHVGPAADVVGDAGGIATDEGERSGADRARFLALVEEHGVHPALDADDRLEILVGGGCEGVASGVPVVALGKGVAKRADVAQGEGEPLAPGGGGDPGGVADQSETVAIRMLDPGVIAGEGGERPRGANTLQRLRWDAAVTLRVEETVARAFARKAFRVRGRVGDVGRARASL